MNRFGTIVQFLPTLEFVSNSNKKVVFDFGFSIGGSF
jgi:hypothetical protein